MSLRTGLLEQTIATCLMGGNTEGLGWFTPALVAGGLTAAYIAWDYFQHKRSPVEIYCAETDHNDAILSRCPLLQGTYWPHPLLSNAHLQGIALMRLRVPVHPIYRRERVVATDGATLLLDWCEGDGPLLHDRSPIVCLLSGTTGNSRSSYMCYLMQAMRERGWRAVCMNYPGLTEEPMTAPRFFCIDSVSDVDLFVNYVHNLYPEAPIFGTGFSVGGHFFLKYLEEVESTPLKGTVALSAPFSTRECDNFWKGRWINERVYDQHFLSKFQGGVFKNKEVFSQVEYIDLEQIGLARNMYELHLSFTVPLSKLNTLDEYYEQNESAKRIGDIPVPTLILHAWDDPVIPRCAIPVEGIQKNPNTILAATQAGGHTGWLTGCMPLSRLGWCEDVTIQYIQALLDLQEQPSEPTHS